MPLTEAFEVHPAGASTNAGLELVHEPCGAAVCAVEPGTKLSTLTLMASDHSCATAEAATAQAQGIVSITKADLVFLDAVSAGLVHYLGGGYVHGRLSRNASPRRMSARANRLDAYIDRRAVSVPPDARFPDHYVVGLTALGHEALARARAQHEPSHKDG